MGLKAGIRAREIKRIAFPWDDPQWLLLIRPRSPTVAGAAQELRQKGRAPVSRLT